MVHSDESALRQPAVGSLELGDESQRNGFAPALPVIASLRFGFLAYFFVDDEGADH